MSEEPAAGAPGAPFQADGAGTAHCRADAASSRTKPPRRWRRPPPRCPHARAVVGILYPPSLPPILWRGCGNVAVPTGTVEVTTIGGRMGAAGRRCPAAAPPQCGYHHQWGAGAPTSVDVAVTAHRHRHHCHRLPRARWPPRSGNGRPHQKAALAGPCHGAVTTTDTESAGHRHHRCRHRPPPPPSLPPAPPATPGVAILTRGAGGSRRKAAIAGLIQE